MPDKPRYRSDPDDPNFYYEVLPDGKRGVDVGYIHDPNSPNYIPPEPKKYQNVFIYGNQIITYESVDPKSFDQINKKIEKLITANPDVNLSNYHNHLKAEIIRVEKPAPTKPTRRLGFIGRNDD